ncbi:MAG: ankyrin repeat domain-containing protein, partial [Campylobacteraceae bacterium]|nr:ankyrin repeat domain-containing protein [Campylobacteraceae bacterium]
MIFKNLFKSKTEDFDTLIQKNNIDKIIKYINHNNINLQENIEEYLILAIDNNNYKFLQYLATQNLEFPSNLEGVSILSYALSNKTQTSVIETIIKNKCFCIEYPYGFTPFETAIRNQQDIEIFKLLIDENILEYKFPNPSIAHQILQEIKLSDNLKINIFNYLIKNDKFDINELNQNNQFLIQVAFDLKNKRLVEFFLECGASIKTIHEDFTNLFTTVDEIEKVSPFLVKKQALSDIKYFSSFLSYDDFMELLHKLDDLKNIQILHLITSNALINFLGKINLCKIALEKGCLIDELNSDNEKLTSLQYFCKNYTLSLSDFSLIDFFLDNGAVFNLNNNSMLVFPVLYNNTKLVEHLVSKRGIDINEINAEGEGVINALVSFLYLDTIDKKIKMLKHLLKLGLDINQKVVGINTDTAQNSSIVDILLDDQNNHALLEYILKNVDDVILEDQISYMFAKKANDNLCKLMIEKNPSYTSDFYYKVTIDFEKYYFSAQPLDMAINWERHELAEYLLNKYPNMKTYTEHRSLIEMALSHNFSIDFIKKIIDKDPDINRLYYFTRNNASSKEKVTTKQTTLISVISCLKNIKRDKVVEIIEYLLEKGADANIPLTKTNLGHAAINEEHALLYALKENIDKQLLDLLIDKGKIDLNELRSGRNESLVLSSLGAVKLSDESLLEHLKYFRTKCDFDLEHKNAQGDNLLLKAASRCLAKCIEYVIDLGSDAHVIGGFDNSPAIHKAISNYTYLDKYKRAQTVEVLLKAGVNKEQFDSEQLTPLMSACKYGCFEVVVKLLENGANPNNKNSANSNAATVIIPHDFNYKNYSYDDEENFEENKSKILAVLKDYGCDLNNVPLDGSTILNNAIGYNLKTIFNTLLQL